MWLVGGKHSDIRGRWFQMGNCLSHGECVQDGWQAPMRGFDGASEAGCERGVTCCGWSGVAEAMAAD